MQRVIAILMIAAIAGCASQRRIKPDPITYSPFSPHENNLLNAIPTYEFGDSREPLMAVQDLIRDAGDSPERTALIANHLGDMLSTDATLDCKLFICRQLHVIGKRENVPQIAPLLTDPDTSDMARFALERIDSQDVNTALLKALGETDGAVKAGIINSLARIGTSRAVHPLERLLTDPDPQVAEAAKSALKKIGR